MVLCSVPWCKNRSDYRDWKRRVNGGNDDVKITFHSFPKNATTRSLWLDILRINLPSIPTGARICSKHFEEKFLDRSSPSLVRLKPNALPRKELTIEPATKTNVLDAPMEIQNKLSDPDQNCGIEASHEVHHSHTVEASSSVTDTSILQPSTSKIDKATIVSLDDCFEISNECQPSVKLSTSTADKSTMTSLEQIYQSPEKCRLRRRIGFVKEESRKKVRNLQQNLRRHTDEIATLKSVLKTLRENLLLNEEQADMLHTLDILSSPCDKRKNCGLPRS